MKSKLTDREKPAVLEGAYLLLRQARDQVARVGCPRTLARVRLAITSIKGAIRNAESLPYREMRKR